jgi:diguanylate cyclase (GGDEF)-like protein
MARRDRGGPSRVRGPRNAVVDPSDRLHPGRLLPITLHVPTEDLNAIRRLQALMDIARVVGGDESIPSVLDAIARVLTDTVGFAGVVINVYRPQWDDYEAATVLGPPEMREQLLGATYDASWIELVLDERFNRRGAYFIPEGALDWEAAAIGARFLPEPIEERDGEGLWRPGDELFVPCRDSDGEILAIISLGEPVSGRRSSDTELDFLVAVGRHAALALEQAHRTAEASRHRAALEHLLAVSSKLAEKVSIESVMDSVCEGVQQALGFQKVLIELVDPATGMLAPRASAGWAPGQEPSWELPLEEIIRLLDPTFERGGCYLVPYADAVARAGRAFADSGSQMHGRGPRAWDRHRLYVPLRDATGAIVGRIWADEPEDLLVPSRARLEALALFAGQATMAMVSAGQLEQLRVLADQDPLTTLPNRRAFMRELEAEVERAGRYGHALALVIGDVDDFKLINDTYGHPAGDRALIEVADTLRAGLRTSDAAFRLGGDEFALLLPETTREEASGVVRRLDAAFRSTASEAFAELTISCGFATAPTDGADAEALIRAADANLYALKRERARANGDAAAGPVPSGA